ncbi:MAG: PIN domain-containing protein [Candidatus Nanoarchaeia archaeon]
MKELFKQLPKTDSPEYIVDTCFLYWIIEHQHFKPFILFCKKHVVAVTSFTIEEVLYHAHDVDEHVRSRLRRALKKDLRLFRYDIDVFPGNFEEEHAFVSKTVPELIPLIPDPSDAVIAAVAYQTKAHLLTRDKHHLFTTQLNNFFTKKGIRVLNNLE